MNFRPIIIGRGRLARHLLHLFAHRGFSSLHFADARTLAGPSTHDLALRSFHELALHATHAWLAISDQALVEVRERIRQLAPNLEVIHSSAATQVPDAMTLHPLMTLSAQLYTPEQYQQISWTTFSNEEPAPRLFERTLRIPGEDRVRYHAACVMHSSLSQLLWEAGESIVPSVPRDAWTSILNQSVQNFAAEGRAAMTGPLVRGDVTTLAAHREALAGTSALKLYESFVRHYQEGKS